MNGHCNHGAWRCNPGQMRRRVEPTGVLDRTTFVVSDSSSPERSSSPRSFSIPDVTASTI
jgi:hypothetical protein